jgi:ABC-type uncharacterized transport system permease subunit
LRIAGVNPRSAIRNPKFPLMLLWYASGLVAAIAVAWLSAMLHVSGHAPVGLLSLGVGILLGATLVGIAATQKIASGKRLVVGTILLAIVAVLAEHAWLYGEFRRQWHDARSKTPEVALFRPEAPWSPPEYFARELTSLRAALWCLDAALIVIGAVAAQFVLRRIRHPTPDP